LVTLLSGRRYRDLINGFLWQLWVALQEANHGFDH
jgi:hypothetical protein